MWVFVDMKNAGTEENEKATGEFSTLPPVSRCLVSEGNLIKNLKVYIIIHFGFGMSTMTLFSNFFKLQDFFRAFLSSLS